MSNLLFFFGAGASAPFGIPTMQGMVKEFETALNKAGPTEEQELYKDVVGFLDAILGRQTDLEAVFTVIDSILNWSPDRLGVASLYHAWRVAATRFQPGVKPTVTKEDFLPPAKSQIETARSLESRFEKFVQNECQIRDGQSERIENVLRDLFTRAGGGVGGQSVEGSGRSYVIGNWSMFTTNYDAILEHYWLDHVQQPLNTGFSYNSTARMEISNPEQFRQAGGLRLFKLHGSITWLQDGRWGLTEQRVPPQEMKTYTGRKFLGQVMLYPIEEKSLYSEPYITMYSTLNRELATTPRWVFIGYSFGDRVVRDIVVRNSRGEVITVIVHPRATEIASKLEGFRGPLRPIDARFGEAGYQEVNDRIQRALRGEQV